jgi:hypothetical protein
MLGKFAHSLLGSKAGVIALGIFDWIAFAMLLSLLLNSSAAALLKLILGSLITYSSQPDNRVHYLTEQ